MGIAFLMGRVVRRLTSPARAPRWVLQRPGEGLRHRLVRLRERAWPVPCERSEPAPFTQRWPRVPPTFMTASEHARWEFESRQDEVRERFAELVKWARGGLACSRPETSAQLAEQARAAQRRMVTFQEEQARRAAEGRPCEVGAPWSDYCLEHGERLAKCHQKGRLTDERYAALLADYQNSLRG